MPGTRLRNAVLAVIVGVALVELLRTAWIGDDAAITLRCVLNLLHGYGATFNVDERVQPYTHPPVVPVDFERLVLTRNVFVSTFMLSIVSALAVVWLLVTRVATRFWAGVLGAAVLLLSKAYVDFSTSGLENPLSHLLILLVVLSGSTASKGSDVGASVRFFFACSLLYLSRPDLLVLIGPLALLVMVSSRHAPRMLIRAMSVGALPAIAWTVFSLYYYGFPFPNTAYAKLGAGIPPGDLAVQGGKYLLDSMSRDPLTLASACVGCALGVRATRLHTALACGVLLYLAFVVSIGGDFMTGRFLTAPLLVAVVLLARSDLSRRQLQLAACGVGVLALPGLGATVFSGARYADATVDTNGIADERGLYFPEYGLMAAKSNILRRFRQPAWELDARAVSVRCGGMGFTGLEDGPGIHLIDDCGLADPLLARLPAEGTRRWRIGHFNRQLPTDYEESVERRANLLFDPGTRAFYASIRKITRGPLNDVSRWREILRMNLGLVQAPDGEMYRHTTVPRSSRTPAR